jgi:hypothetical protein
MTGRISYHYITTMARVKRRGDIAANLFPDPAPPLSPMQRVLGDHRGTLRAIVSFLCPVIDDLPEDYQLCITDIAPCMRVLARMASVSIAWNAFVHEHIGRFNQILHKLETGFPPHGTMDGGYRLYKFLTCRISAYPGRPREFLQILGTISASAEGLMEYVRIATTDNTPSHWLALPSAEGHTFKLSRHRKIALHLIGSHVIGDIGSSPFCNEVTRRLDARDHSAFDPDLEPINIIHRRIVGYLALHNEAQVRGLGQVPLLSSNHGNWNRTLVKALTPHGRSAILHVLLQDVITAAREAGLDD